MKTTYAELPRSKFFDANLSIIEFEGRRLEGANLFAEVDLTAIETARSQTPMGQRRTPYTAFVIRAVAQALREFPDMNTKNFLRFLPFLGQRRFHFKHSDIAVAAERKEPGLEEIVFCDTLRAADALSLGTITTWLTDLSQATTVTNKQWREFDRAIRRLPRWLAKVVLRLPCYLPKLWIKYRGGAAVVSSPAKYGVDVVVATWVWPLGVSFGLVRKRPVIHAGQTVARPTFTLTLSFDRNLFAEERAELFFRRLIQILESSPLETEVDHDQVRK